MRPFFLKTDTKAIMKQEYRDLKNSGQALFKVLVVFLRALSLVTFYLSSTLYLLAISFGNVAFSSVATWMTKDVTCLSVVLQFLSIYL